MPLSSSTRSLTRSLTHLRAAGPAVDQIAEQHDRGIRRARLGIVGLVLAFLFPLLGLILSIVAANQVDAKPTGAGKALMAKLGDRVTAQNWEEKQQAMEV